MASYPFTTLQPQLGVVRVNPFLTLTMADIPGLIPGAARNRGLGHAFLRHISRARALIYILDSSSGLGETPGLRPWEQLAALQVHRQDKPCHCQQLQSQTFFSFLHLLLSAALPHSSQLKQCSPFYQFIFHIDLLTGQAISLLKIGKG